MAAKVIGRAKETRFVGAKRKMKKLRLFLEYGCYPVWSYDEEGMLIEDDFPEDDKPTERLEELKTVIAKEFASTFINNEHEFSPKGFDSKEDARKFIAHLDEFRALVKERYPDYEVVDDFYDFSDEAQ